jgi:hypothetical protein
MNYRLIADLFAGAMSLSGLVMTGEKIFLPGCVFFVIAFTQKEFFQAYKQTKTLPLILQIQEYMVVMLMYFFPVLGWIETVY